MTDIIIVNATEDEWLQYNEEHLKKIPGERQREPPNKFREFSKNYDLNKNWEKWMEWKKYPQSHFLFNTRSVPDDPTLFIAYIINAPEVVWTLQQHYELFSRELKMEFDPIAETLEFENSKSQFWEKVFSNDCYREFSMGMD